MALGDGIRIVGGVLIYWFAFALPALIVVWVASRASLNASIARAAGLAGTGIVLGVVGPTVALTYDEEHWYGSGAEPVFGPIPAILLGPALWVACASIWVAAEVALRSLRDWPGGGLRP